MSAVNDRCIRCGAPAGRSVKALEIRTLHVRSLTGERRVQALGDEKQGAVCDRCARESLDLSTNPLRAVKRKLLVFGSVLAFGILVEALTFLFLGGHQVFVLFGIAALLCGVLGIVDAVRGANAKSRALRMLPESEALEEAAWDVFTAEAPKKEKDEDLTYIPVNEKTMARKNGDLMILYRLLPDIAVQAWNRLHRAEKEKEESDDPPHCNV